MLDPTARFQLRSAVSWAIVVRLWSFAVRLANGSRGSRWRRAGTTLVSSLAHYLERLVRRSEGVVVRRTSVLAGRCLLEFGLLRAWQGRSALL